MLKGYKLFPNSGINVMYSATTHFYWTKFNLKKKYCDFFLNNYLFYFFYRHGNSDFYKKGLKGSLILKKLKLSMWLATNHFDIHLIFLNAHFFFKTFSTNCLLSIGSAWTYLKYLKGHREMIMSPAILTSNYNFFYNTEESTNIKFKFRKRVVPRYELLEGDQNVIKNLPRAHSNIKYKTQRSAINIQLNLKFLIYVLFFKNSLKLFTDFLNIWKFLIIRNF